MGRWAERVGYRGSQSLYERTKTDGNGFWRAQGRTGAVCSLWRGWWRGDGREYGRALRDDAAGSSLLVRFRRGDRMRDCVELFWKFFCDISGSGESVVAAQAVCAVSDDQYGDCCRDGGAARGVCLSSWRAFFARGEWGCDFDDVRRELRAESSADVGIGAGGRWSGKGRISRLGA